MESNLSTFRTVLNVTTHLRKMAFFNIAKRIV